MTRLLTTIVLAVCFYIVVPFFLYVCFMASSFGYFRGKHKGQEEVKNENEKEF